MPVEKNIRIHNPDGSTSVRVTKLRQRILETGKPQYITAAAAGIHPYSLSLYVQGKRDITVKHLKALMEVLNVPAGDILGWDIFVVPGELANTAKTPHLDDMIHGSTVKPSNG